MPHIRPAPIKTPAARADAMTAWPAASSSPASPRSRRCLAAAARRRGRGGRDRRPARRRAHPRRAARTPASRAERDLPLAGVEVVRADGRPRRRARRAARRPGRRLGRAQPARAGSPPSRSAACCGGCTTPASRCGGSRGVADADIDAPEAWATHARRGRDRRGRRHRRRPRPPRTSPGASCPATTSSTTTPTRRTRTATARTSPARSPRPRTASASSASRPQAHVMPLRVLDDAGGGNSADVAAAFAYAGDRGVRVVNASLGSPYPSLAERRAIHDHPGTLFVVAAGNGGPDGVGDDNDDDTREYPCAHDEPNLICVGATDVERRARRRSPTTAPRASTCSRPGQDIVSDVRARPADRARTSTSARATATRSCRGRRWPRRTSPAPRRSPPPLRPGWIGDAAQGRAARRRRPAARRSPARRSPAARLNAADAVRHRRRPPGAPTPPGAGAARPGGAGAGRATPAPQPATAPRPPRRRPRSAGCASPAGRASARPPRLPGAHARRSRSCSPPTPTSRVRLAAPAAARARAAAGARARSVTRHAPAGPHALDDRAAAARHARCAAAPGGYAGHRRRAASQPRRSASRLELRYKVAAEAAGTFHKNAGPDVRQPATHDQG